MATKLTNEHEREQRPVGTLHRDDMMVANLEDAITFLRRAMQLAAFGASPTEHIFAALHAATLALSARRMILDGREVARGDAK